MASPDRERVVVDAVVDWVELVEVVELDQGQACQTE
jgi:hypothetical protein